MSDSEKPFTSQPFTSATILSFPLSIDPPAMLMASSVITDPRPLASRSFHACQVARSLVPNIFSVELLSSDQSCMVDDNKATASKAKKIFRILLLLLSSAETIEAQHGLVKSCCNA